MKKANGFTLVELLITMTVASLIGGLLISILISNTGLFYKETTQVAQGLGLNDALSKIRSNIKQANTVAIEYVDLSTTYISSESQLVLRLAAIDSFSGIIDGSFDYVVYYLTTDQLWMEIFPSSTSSRKHTKELLASKVDKLIFEYFDINNSSVSPQNAVSVKVSIKLQQLAGRNVESSVATSEANLRND